MSGSWGGERIEVRFVVFFVGKMFASSYSSLLLMIRQQQQQQFHACWKQTARWTKFQNEYTKEGKNKNVKEGEGMDERRSNIFCKRLWGVFELGAVAKNTVTSLLPCVITMMQGQEREGAMCENGRRMMWEKHFVTYRTIAYILNVYK